MKTKRKVYDGHEEFDADRRKMWAKGWFVVEERKQPVVKPSCASADLHSLGATIVLSPTLLLGWLIYRKAPDEEIVVTYGRE